MVGQGKGCWGDSGYGGQAEGWCGDAVKGLRDSGGGCNFFQAGAVEDEQWVDSGSLESSSLEFADGKVGVWGRGSGVGKREEGEQRCPVREMGRPGGAGQGGS